MRRLFALPLCLMLLGPAAAEAKTTKFAVSSTANSIAPKQSPILLAGDLKGTFGAGAIVIRSTVTGASSAKATVTIFTERGVLRATTTYTFSFTGAVGLQATTTLTGTGKVTSGTGAYRRVKGSFTFSGISPSGEAFYQLKVKGSLTRR